MDTEAVHNELERARATFHELLARATPAELKRGSAGTRWTNRQLLFHVLLGFLIMKALLMLARGFSRLPRGASRGFARVLNAGTRPFDRARSSPRSKGSATKPGMRCERPGPRSPVDR